MIPKTSITIAVFCLFAALCSSSVLYGDETHDLGPREAVILAEFLYDVLLFQADVRPYVDKII